MKLRRSVCEAGCECFVSCHSSDKARYLVYLFFPSYVIDFFTIESTSFLWPRESCFGISDSLLVVCGLFLYSIVRYEMLIVLFLLDFVCVWYDVFSTLQKCHMIIFVWQ